MKVLFFGNSSYSIPYLQALTESNWLVYVIVDKIQKINLYFFIKFLITKLKLAQSIKEENILLSWQNHPKRKIIELANNSGFPKIYFKNINSKKFIKKCKKISPDFIIVAGFNHIINNDIINIPSKGCINFHPSLLPLYRGPVPCFWTIAKGEKVTGVTAHYMTTEIDGGPIIEQQKVQILESDTGGSLERKIATEGAKLMRKLILQGAKSRLEANKQDTIQATYFQRPSKKELQINWGQTSLDIYNLVRASKPWYKPYFIYKNKKIQIIDCKILNQKNKKLNGEIISINSDIIDVACNDGTISLTKLELEDSPLSISYFVKQNKIKTCMMLT